MDNEFGKKLKNMMRSNKVGRPAVAGKLGVTARTVSRYVTGIQSSRKRFCIW